MMFLLWAAPLFFGAAIDVRIELSSGGINE